MMIDIGQIIFTRHADRPHPPPLCPEKYGIGFAQHKLPGSLVERIIDTAAAEIWQTQRPGAIGIVYHERVSVAVNFIGPDLAISSVLCLAILVERGWISVVSAFASPASFASLRTWLASAKAGQDSPREEICGNKQRISAGIVRRAKHGKIMPTGKLRDCRIIQR